MMLRVFLIAALLALPGAHGAQKPSDPSKSASAATCAASPDDAAIYSAALTKVVLKDRNDNRQIVLLSQTSAGYPAGMASFTASSTPDKRELLDAASTATKNDFDGKTKLNCDLTTIAALGAGVVFMSPEERDELFSKAGGWKDFAQKYPNAAGFTIVSAIGFDAAHRQALVYVGNSCGMLCGTGYIVLLEKKKDKWIVAKTAKIWNAT
ncbi:MAG: hypothetical protein WCC03_19695 [Candidatus Acidiferrales bacterium]